MWPGLSRCWGIDQGNPLLHFWLLLPDKNLWFLTAFCNHELFTHAAYPNDKVIANSGTIECVDGDDFSPTWNVSELKLLLDEPSISWYLKLIQYTEVGQGASISRPGTEEQQHIHKVEHNET